ncbi:MAG: hypothetical protein M0O93_01245 [Bacteroidales bacterium]|nr:hypothetical protein [Bacteroidales bacterium]
MKWDEYIYTRPVFYKLIMNLFLKQSFFIVIIFISLSSLAQKRISASVEIKQVKNKKVITIKKDIFYQSNGNFVVHMTKPQEYYVVTNSLGEAKAYMPQTNEVLIINDPFFSSQNELLYSFLSNDFQDFGLQKIGFKLKSQKKEGTKIIKTFITDKKEIKDISKIEMVYEKNLPIYSAYYKQKEITRKIYYNKYMHFKMFTFPTQITEISYDSPSDSTVKREVYSNIKVDEFIKNSLFDYKIPASAKLVSPFSKK